MTLWAAEAKIDHLVSLKSELSPSATSIQVVPSIDTSGWTRAKRKHTSFHNVELYMSKALQIPNVSIQDVRIATSASKFAENSVDEVRHISPAVHSTTPFILYYAHNFAPWNL